MITNAKMDMYENGGPLIWPNLPVACRETSNLPTILSLGDTLTKFKQSVVQLQRQEDFIVKIKEGGFKLEEIITECAKGFWMVDREISADALALFTPAFTSKSANTYYATVKNGLIGAVPAQCLKL